MCYWVRNYVKGCATCQQNKIDWKGTPWLNPIARPMTSRPFAQISMDFITDLPPSHDFDSILLIIDHGMSKGIILVSCNKTATASDTAQMLIDNLYQRFSLPNKAISDRGPQFASKAFKELLKISGVTSSLSMAFHPKSDSFTK